ncbi:MAG: 4Fe-4S dicluster domain-containing protein [Deltaproteobacteria bacterium]|nr:4Fe-4S dicluster domain-containing protein [Deltaproteobacteria bacterium]
MNRFRIEVPDQRWFEEHIRCEHACPVHTRAPQYISAITHEDYDLAFKMNREDNLFPAILGRICVHPCEEKCRRGLLIDSPISICSLKRSSADHKTSSPQYDQPLVQRGKRIAVIGAGPSGLSAANDLARMGYGVTIFESFPIAGGMLNVGIPSYRLPREVVTHAIEEVKRLGVSFIMDTPVGKELNLETLRKEFDAVYIAAGAHKAEKLGIPGENFQGVIHGVTFMRMVNLEEHFRTGDKVAVVGGGNTAMDAARSSFRLGAKEVFILYRRTREEMPVDARELDQVEEEGIKVHYLTQPVQVLSKDGITISGVRCIRNRLGEIGKDGRRRPIPIEGSEFDIDLDLLIPAVSQSPDLSFLPEEIGLEISKWDRLAVNPETSETNVPGIFAGGDFVTGPRDVIRVIADGRKAALSIHSYLSGEVIERRPGYFTPAQEIESDPDLEKIPRQKMDTLPIEERKSIEKEVELGFAQAEAVKEAMRCLKCHLFTIFDRTKCILCGGCVDICPKSCFRMARLNELERDKTFSKLIESLYCASVEEAEKLNLATVMIKDESRCIQCSLCVKRCPTGAITMEEYRRESQFYRGERR